MSTAISSNIDTTLNTAREALYRFASLAFADPLYASTWTRLSDPQSQDCVRAAAELIRNQPTMTPARLGFGELPIELLDPSRILEQLADSAEALNAEYEKTFGLLVTKACPPCETEYIDSKLAFQRSHQLADVAGFLSCLWIGAFTRSAGASRSYLAGTRVHGVPDPAGDSYRLRLRGGRCD